jgi:acetyltransferase-like isoleucine patch superfamily enzyme
MKFNNRNIYIHDSVKLGVNVEIGDNTTIYPNVIIEDNCIIADNCIIGEPLNDYYRNRLLYKQPLTIIKKNSLIRSFTIVYASSYLGENFTTGHHVTIREKTVVGNNCSFGSYNDIQGNCEIGSFCRFHSYVNIGQKSKIGSYVFIYPFTVLTNDATPPSYELKGSNVGDFTQIGAKSLILPGVILGNNCFVAAGSVVNGVFKENSFISGYPAKRLGELSKMPFFNEHGKKHYPWPYNFERGMPWEGIGFDKWKEENDTLS